MTFDWTISLGTLLSTITLLIAFVGGAWHLVTNHVKHLVSELKAELLAHEARETTFVAERFAMISTSLERLEKDIRELRDWNHQRPA